MKYLILLFGFTFFLGSNVSAQSKDSVCVRIDEILKHKILDYHFTFKKVTDKDGFCNMELTYFLGAVERFELNVYVGKTIQNAAGSSEKLSADQLKLIMDPKATKIVIDPIMVRDRDGNLKKITGTNAAIILEQQK